MNASQPAPGNRGFTLVELMVSLAVISLLVILLASITGQTSNIWRRTTGKTEQFREVRAGFDAMTTRLAQATLNTYWDYDNRNDPKKYLRRSELRFISGPHGDLLGSSAGRSRVTHSTFFQAPLGVTEAQNANGSEKYAGFENLLCTWGYYVEYGDDKQLRPPFLPDSKFPLRSRFRLMELWQPSEKNSIYTMTSGFDATKPGRPPKAIGYNGKDWFQKAANAANPSAYALAENVVALILTPRLAPEDELDVKGKGGSADLSPLAPNYLYDSAPPTGTGDTRYKDGRINPLHQLPPIIQVTMVAIDEISASRLNLDASTIDPFGLQNRFKKSADYTRDLSLSGDPDSLENTLIQNKLNYRIFTTNVVLRGAKWSRETTN